MISDIRRLSQAAMEVTAQEEEDMEEVVVEDVAVVEDMRVRVAKEEEVPMEEEAAAEEDVGVVEVVEDEVEL
jgi:hypothetical protein